jgi:hypothetical protein
MWNRLHDRCNITKVWTKIEVFNMKSTASIIGLTAQVLTPFYYHGLYARDGSATYPNVITDTALLFALRTTLLGTSPALRGKPDYKADLLKIPWRASLLQSAGNQMLPPVRHTIDVEREGGNHEVMQKNMASGNFKKTFFVHEVAANSTYQGILYGVDPFEWLQTDCLVVRVGVARLGMLALKRAKTLLEKEARVCLNTATAQLFGRTVKEEYRILDTIRVSQALPVAEAVAELKQWY